MPGFASKTKRIDIFRPTVNGGNLVKKTLKANQ